MNFYFNWSPDWTEFIDVEYYTFKYQLLIINIFYILLYSLILLLITRNSLFIVWLIMEAIVFFTIPIILSFKKESINSESVVIYFFKQCQTFVERSIFSNNHYLRRFLTKFKSLCFFFRGCENQEKSGKHPKCSFLE